jgi:sugar/nucleoside kinase (ribokinase family)
MKRSRVLVVGDVVDDLLVRPLGEVAYGSDTPAEIRHRPGGSAANVAAWLGTLGVAVTFVGRAGHNSAADQVAALDRHGVDARIAVDSHRSTASIVLLVDGAGQRTMYVDRGANTELVPRDVPDDVWRDVGVLHLTGYTFFDPATRPVALELITAARKRHVAVSVDPSSAAYVRQAGARDVRDWVRGVDLLLPNEEEAQLLADRTDAGEAAGVLADDCKSVVVTLGGAGALVHTSDGGAFQRQAVAAEVLDTTGAGDGFAAGWIAAWVAGAPLADRMAAGLEVSARAVTILGGRP